MRPLNSTTRTPFFFFLATLATVLLVGSGSFAQTTCDTHWEINFAIASSPTPVAELRFDLTESNPDGRIPRSDTLFSPSDCSISPGLAGSLSTSGQYATVTLSSSLSSGFIARCTWAGSAPPSPSDFTLTVFSALDSSLVAISPSPTLTAQVECSNCGNGNLDPGESCDPGVPGDACCNPSSCDLTPKNGCYRTLANSTSSKVLFSLKDSVSDDTRNKLKFAWGEGPEFGLDDLGDPTTSTAYSVCMWNLTNPGTLESAAFLEPTAFTWSNKGSKGFVYKTKAGFEGGITKLAIRPGSRGRGTVRVQGKGENLDFPGPASTIQYTEAFQWLVQVVNTRSSCWEGRLIFTQNDPENLRGLDSGD